ncbi:hypothetical protein BBO99_00004741 [Phytophthora kernoviae]|uniref:EF-hand domain-containing protein n=1 Tax=Phytophthora kernoviae TaxID=325452 RepID=A0A3R7H6Z0_9STRA|nr:hypothetical protein BBI17_002510 [Phytophthora kernoviae]RLN80136.1 hypothetical protein BBO99_00004741 [Phytophthora kernoviae]
MATTARVQVSAVTLLLQGETRELLLYRGIPLLELQQCILAGFSSLAKSNRNQTTKKLVAVRHAATNVFYPLSLLCRSPELFEGAVYYLVVDNDSSGASATVRENIRKSRSQHGKRGRRAERPQETPLDQVAATTDSDANEEDEQVDELEEDTDWEGMNGGLTLEDDGLDIDLTDFELPMLVNVFTQACPTGALDRITFERCLEKILSQSGRYDPQARKMFTRLFNIFDDQSQRLDVVDVAEFLGGVSVFACGERDEKIQLTFELYDMDGDGFISKEEMTKYLTAVFLVIGEVSPELFQQNEVDPAELGVVTASQCFAESTLNQEGKLSYEEFRVWYSKPGPTQLVAQSRANKSTKDGFRVNGMQTTEGLDLATLHELVKDHTASAKHTLNAWEKMQLQQIMESVFDGFDTDHDGFIDFCELSSGISVLCSGSQQDKVKSAFSLFDINQDGFIALDEMETYLTSVYRIIFMISPSVMEQFHRISPEELGRITTADAFTLADANKDGRLSFDEFTKWYSNGSMPQLAAQPQHSRVSTDVPYHLKNTTAPPRVASLSSKGVLSEMKELTNLGAYDVNDIFEFFQASADREGNVTQPVFFRCFNKLLAKDEHINRETQMKTQQLLKELFELFDADKNDVVDVQELGAGLSILCGGSRADKARSMFTLYDTTPALSVEESTRVHEVIDRLFTAFDADQSGSIDFNELISGLSILCGASTRDQKVLAAFRVYDRNGDGVISEDEMTHYLGSVFKLLYALDPTRQQQLGISAYALAAATTSEIFEDADINHDGKLTFDEFQKWYSKPEQTSFNDIVAPLGLNEVRQLTNLGNLDVVEVFEQFAEHADEEGMLNRKSFDKCFFEIIEMAHPRTQIEKLRAKMVADRLYDVFDRDGNGQIDFSELASGLSVLCKGARDAKVKAAFRLYDFNADGFISLDEMKRYLTSIFKVLYEVQPEMRKETGVSAEELGIVTAEQAFLEADSNHDGKLSYDEFLTWYNSPAQAGISSAVAKNAIVDSSLHWMPLNEIKQLTNLAQYEPEEVFEIFAGEADEEGLLSRHAFNESFRKVIDGQKANGNSQSRSTNPDTQKKLQEVIDGLFDLFDKDDSGSVDFGELASGLSVLCGGTKDQKVEAAFSLFDFNGDGFISLDEMTRYLTSVFRVLFQVSPDTQSLGVTPEELGEVTAQQAFAEADQDHDGQLTLKEFQHWYQQPGGIGEVAKNGEQLFSLAEARRLTNLQAFSPMEVFEALADCADEQGYVSREAFDGCFRKIISENQGIKAEEYQRINPILNRFFELFDVDKNGMVDFSEISSGLSVFCGGSSEDKIRAAFALYDYNADGYISMDEMTRYLTSVFKVLKETSPAALQQMGHESPEELGARTAQQAFAEADLDHDGRLSFPEFRKWYTRSNAANMERLIQNNIPEWLSLREVRRLTNLGSFSAQQVLNTFAKFTSADGAMDKDTFRQALGHFKVEDASEKLNDRLQLLVDRIFELFDKDNNGLVDFNELASGLSVLCGGSQTDKVRAAFNLYDVNHDGYISLGEMRLYLTSVFKVLFEVNPDNEARTGVSPEELGEITAEQAFVEADLDKDGKLSFEEFSQWYMQPKQVGDLPIPAVLDEQQPQQLQEQQQVPDWVSLGVVKEMTNLEKYTADEVFEIFANRCSEDGTLSREAFEECFEQLVDEQYKNDESNLARLRIILNRLFVIFDEDHNGTVDFCELSSGLSVLCGGSREEKVRAAFSLYDLNQDGFISLDEMVRYLASVFKVLYETSPGTNEKLGVQPDELATITAEQCFLEADLNEDAKLSFDEFVAWYSKSSGFEAPAAGVSSLLNPLQQDGQHEANGTSSASFSLESSKGSNSLPAPKSPRKTLWGSGNGSNDISTAPVSFPSDKIYGVTGSNGDALLSPKSASALNMNSSNMERVRQLLKLDSYEVNDVLEIFAEAAPSGELTFAAFKKCFDQIIRLAGGHASPEERQEAEVMIRRLFRVFDTDNSNTVDFGELASGLSVLSGSSMDDKVRAAFQLYDINGDGYITQEEMINYMTSIFKVMYETTDNTKTKMGVTPEELASATAEQCFKEADLNHDNKLSFEEFKKVQRVFAMRFH